jgi:tetratricopeptide (TPR) repeat protein
MEAAVSKRTRYRRVILGFLLVCATLSAEDIPKQKLDQIYQSAVADYDAGRFSAAADQLEKVLPYATKSYEVHELLGMVYASMSDNAKAVDHLKLAVQLKPDSAAARTNLGAVLMQSGKSALAGEQFRKALQLEPQSFDANHNLGEFYIKSGNVADALPLLQKAAQIDPGSSDNSYDLAMADYVVGQLDAARALVESLVRRHDAAELHNLLGQIDEKDGKFVDAANEYQTALHMDPSEENFFDLGCEMLLHRTYEPAIAVFQTASQRYPNSPRIWIGLGLALYSRGKYDDAVKALMSAADLNAADPRCYLFLSKAYDSSPTQADEVTDRFRRYAELKPDDALAQYYYAISLWKGRRAQSSTVNIQQIEELLKRSIALNSSIPEAHVQLGDLYSDQHEWDKSIPEYERALELNPNLSDAHYRLGTDYVHVGKKDRAQKEFAVYQTLRAQHLAELDKERADVKQFVYSEKGDPDKP